MDFNHQSYGDRKFLVAIFLMCHCGFTIYMKKYFKAKEKLWKFQYFTMQKYDLYKKSSKRNQNPLKYHNSITNPIPSFTQAIISSFKNLHIKINLLHGGQNPISYYTP